MRKELLALPSEECKGQCASNTDIELSVRVTNDLQCSQLLLLTHTHTHTHTNPMWFTRVHALKRYDSVAITGSYTNISVSISISREPKTRGLNEDISTLENRFVHRKATQVQLRLAFCPATINVKVGLINFFGHTFHHTSILHYSEAFFPFLALPLLLRHGDCKVSPWL